MKTRTLTAAIAAATMLAAAGSAQAAYPGANGKIAITTSGIATLQSDGSAFDHLTEGFEDYQPTWSPDGTRVAFTRWEGGLRNRSATVFVMNADGSNLRAVATTVSAPRSVPAWPTWSPDGSQIAFSRVYDTTTNGIPDQKIFVIPAAGGPERFVTDGGFPLWSPAGDKIAFTWEHTLPGDDPAQIHRGVWITTPSGANPHRIFDGNATATDWSPDGTRIAFNRFGAGTVVASTMRADGTDIRSLGASLAPPLETFDAAWSPDGRFAVYNVADPNGPERIVIEDLSTGAIRDLPLPATGADFGYPDWQPLPKVNHAPNCKSVRASVTSLWPPDGKMQKVRLLGGSDPDGDPVTVDLAWVGQDEPVTGRGDHTQPDAAWTSDPRVALIRRERSARGDGRVYWIDYWVRDNHGAKCVGTVTVSVPRHRGKPAIASPFYASSVLVNGESKAHARKRRNRLHAKGA